MSLSERVQAKAEERRWLILGVLCFSLLVIVLDNSILNVALPSIVRELGATNTQLQWMVDAYTLVFAGLLLTAGSLGDRFGRRPALQFGFAIFGLGSLASALAGSSTMLIASRGFMGIGGAFIMPTTLSIITNLFPARERGKAIGVWAATAGVGAALGPLTGGFLLQHFYWGSVFLVNLPIVALGLLAGFFLIPDSKDPSAPRLDPLGAVLSIIGLASILFAIIEAPEHGWTAPVTIAGVRVRRHRSRAPSCWWELHCDHPMLDFTFFKNPRFSAASAAITLTFLAMFGSLFVFTPVPAVRARLHPTADRRSPAGLRHTDDDHRAAVAPSRRAGRHEARRRRRHDPVDRGPGSPVVRPEPTRPTRPSPGAWSCWRPASR